MATDETGGTDFFKLTCEAIDVMPFDPRPPLPFPIAGSVAMLRWDAQYLIFAHTMRRTYDLRIRVAYSADGHSYVERQMSYGNCNRYKDPYLGPDKKLTERGLFDEDWTHCRAWIPITLAELERLFPSCWAQVKRENERAGSRGPLYERYTYLEKQLRRERGL